MTLLQSAFNFDIAFAIPRVRANDPDTSIVAAINAEKFAASHSGRIVEALKLHGPASAHRLSLLIGLTVVQLDRRFSELKRMGLVQLTGEVDQGCRVWAIAVSH